MARCTKPAPGKWWRKGLSIYQFFNYFPDEESARRWFAERRWGAGEEERVCPRCRWDRTGERSANDRYWCSKCRRRFSVRTGTVLECSPIPLQKWLNAIYLICANLKGVSSMRLHRELGVTQKTAWFLGHRIRLALALPGGMFSGPVEVDEAYLGGLEGNKHEDRKLHAGRGTVGKVPVVGVRDRESGQVRAAVAGDTTRATLGGFIAGCVEEGSTVYTDAASAYNATQRYVHDTVKHTAGQWRKGDAGTNGIESFWAMLKRAHIGRLPQDEPEAPAAIRR